MSRIVPLSRKERRARTSARRREDRREERHRCTLDEAAAALGRQKVGLAVPAFHAAHRLFGEPSCPRCPVCAELRRAGKIDGRRPPRAETLAAWERALGEAEAMP